MPFLRIATNCAVFDDDHRILLSRRGDLNVWNLPGGRPDSGEPLSEAAAREVREETGVICHVERAVGLYYLAGWDRLNILYAGIPVGGEMFQKSDETRDNRYFAQSDLPDGLFSAPLIHDAFAANRPMPVVITTPPDELRRTRWKLRLRWITNLMRGRPEPRHVRFNVHAAALIFERTHRRVLTLPSGKLQMLPRVRCDGRAPWLQLADLIRRYADWTPEFQWVGLWQDAPVNSLELVFAATVRETDLTNGAQWSPAQNGALTGLDADYVARTPPDFKTAPVWTITPSHPPVDKVEMKR